MPMLLAHEPLGVSQAEVLLSSVGKQFLLFFCSGLICMMTAFYLTVPFLTRAAEELRLFPTVPSTHTRCHPGFALLTQQANLS